MLLASCCRLRMAMVTCCKMSFFDAARATFKSVKGLFTVTPTSPTRDTVHGSMRGLGPGGNKRDRTLAQPRAYPHDPMPAPAHKNAHCSQRTDRPGRAPPTHRS